MNDLELKTKAHFFKKLERLSYRIEDNISDLRIFIKHYIDTYDIEGKDMKTLSRIVSRITLSIECLEWELNIKESEKIYE